MRNAAILGILLATAACAGSRENDGYEVMDFRARWIDRYNVDRRACERSGGIIVQDRYTPKSLRVGRPAPEVGARYRCAHP